MCDFTKPSSDIAIQWSLSLLKKITQEYNSSVGGGAGMRVDSLVKFWVNHPIVSNLCDIMKHSIKYLYVTMTTILTCVQMFKDILSSSGCSKMLQHSHLC